MRSVLLAPVLLLSLGFGVPGVAQGPVGALSGRRITISAGHGYYWHSTLGWTTQRPVIDGLVEDRHTNEIVADHLLPYLEGSGAQIITCRARTQTTEEHLIDNDQGAPGYAELGSWITSGSAGFGGSSYRYAFASVQGGPTATFTTTITNTDNYPVYVAYRAGANRASDVAVEIHHAGGVSVRTLNQQLDDLTWVYLGTFPFRALEVAEVVITTRATSGGVVIADAVKIGDGMGSIVRGGTVSGRSRFLECSRYHAEYFGAPPSVYDSSTSPNDNSDDVTCRPRYAEWRGQGDAYLSLHTNAGGGSGTSTWIHDTSPTAGSASLRNAVHTRLINDLRAEWDLGWQDDGQQSANFGEVRLLSTMPGCLVELAFHDTIGGDLESLHHPRFRRISGRALYRGLAQYLAPGQPFILDPPLAVALINNGQGGLQLRWSAVPGATGYRVRVSEDGFGFDDGIVVSAPTTAYTLPAVPRDARRFCTVSVINAGGTGPASERVGARRAPGGPSPLLMVQGFDRYDRFVKENENKKDGMISDGAAVDAVTAAGYPFDGATNEAVLAGLAPLSPYRLVMWILGEESTVDETFSSAEQTVVTSYLQGGGRLFFSGAEVGWDLDHLGSAADQAFYRNVLGHTYVSDDAFVSFTAPQPIGPFAGLPAMMFDDGSAGIYNVDWPDVVAPTPGTGSQIVLRYSNGLTAGVLHGNGRVLGIGFPIEALVNPAHRALLVERVLALLCPLPVQPAWPVIPGSLTLDISFPSAPLGTYLLGAAFNEHPGIPLPDGREVPLAFDALLAFSTTPGNGLFFNMAGSLDAAGAATASVLIPSDPSLSGVRFVVAGVSVASGGGPLLEISPFAAITLP